MDIEVSVAVTMALTGCPNNRESNYAAAGAYSQRRASYTAHYSSCRRQGGFHHIHYCFFGLTSLTFLTLAAPSAAGSDGSSFPLDRFLLRQLTVVGSLANTLEYN